MNPLASGSIGLFNISIRIDILIRDMLTVDEILDFTDELLGTITSIVVDNNAVGGFIFQDADEVFYDVEGNFLFRTINFIIPVMILFSGAE